MPTREESIAAVSRRYLTPMDVAEITGIALSTLANWRSKTHTTGQEIGPPFIKVGALVRYLEGDVDAWMTSKPRTTVDARASL